MRIDVLTESCEAKERVELTLVQQVQGLHEEIEALQDLIRWEKPWNGNREMETVKWKPWNGNREMETVTIDIDNVLFAFICVHVCMCASLHVGVCVCVCMC